MKRLIRHSDYNVCNLCKQRFIVGDLYLFHPTSKKCPSYDSLWGVYNCTKDGIIQLESSSFDLRHFHIWQSLPTEFHFYRRATRSELRDYMYNMGLSDTIHRPDLTYHFR